jgi:hypothetical protein
VQTAICTDNRVWDMKASAAGLEHSGGEASQDDLLSFDIPDAALEQAAAAIPGGAMSFPNAPTVSILVICCSFND